MPRIPTISRDRDRRIIFISYRRSDSTSWAGRLAGDLRRYFGHEMVYFDTESNRSGQDYVTRIENSLRTSRVVVAVIGPRWSEIPNGYSRSRLHDQSDWVRRELEYALHEGPLVLPVLVGNANAPESNKLPPALAAISRIQMQRLADADWSYDFGRIIETLEKHGIMPAKNDEVSEISLKRRAVKVQSHQRKIQASRRHCLGAVEGAVKLLDYPDLQTNLESAEVTFRVHWLRVSVKVVDAESGWSTVALQFESINTGLLVAGSAVGAISGGIGMLTWPALRSWERYFAAGFLDNVESVLAGRGVIGDSFNLPGVNALLRKVREV
ncbi:toll/interleukin-1 receptor domain-containing protein [Parafrankia sp. BMG5.11]|uniref:toll/interleukin-1 receptor domain-containing protein n=1 Tax=Parafrankia sp. BMG5.11 TaxID=222540 RepID=UPI00103EA51B|nr:toll/interleukin-1 receptor domain-containing protein [Parafrankia sp. BMG5.11]TCJ31490.1 toll/interleukin-1 receptor domain-containing protein [Parafrankia sp. BMG5.11]